MSLTENAKIVYLGTNMGATARRAVYYEHFNDQWCAKILLLSLSNNEDDKYIYNAMKAISSYDFYIDATMH